MKKTYLFLFLLCSSTWIQAQYTEIINSKRPGLSESPYSVGTGVYQVEAGFFYKNSDKQSTFNSTRSIGTNLLLRTGQFFERLEINLDLSYQQDRKKFQNTFTTTKKINGISKFTVGAKFLVYKQKYRDISKEIRSWKKKYSFDWRRIIPSVGIYAGLNTNMLAEGFKDTGMTPKAALLLQNDFTDKLVLITNIIGDKITGDSPEYGYITTITYAPSTRFSMFAENQGIFIKDSNNEFKIGAGFAYLLTPNLQFDISMRTNLNKSYTETYGGLGCSWRLDFHKDSFKIKRQKKRPKRIKSKRGFFSKLFKKH